MPAPRSTGLRPIQTHPLRLRWGLATGASVLSLPFDALRHRYASAVVAGLIPRSIAAAGRLERTLDALEKLILGPLARQR